MSEKETLLKEYREHKLELEEYIEKDFKELNDKQIYAIYSAVNILMKNLSEFALPSTEKEVNEYRKEINLALLNGDIKVTFVSNNMVVDISNGKLVFVIYNSSNRLYIAYKSLKFELINSLTRKHMSYSKKIFIKGDKSE